MRRTRWRPSRRYLFELGMRYSGKTRSHRPRWFLLAEPSLFAFIRLQPEDSAYRITRVERP